ncbi:hypothetical protein QFZ48_000142 [Chitinophaga sp. W2I13]|uniref:hypothetical protein n=1 Tax=Chitinophaga sp. W2I13 TaxID=3373923 RepID=UPI003D1DDE55
MEINFDRKSLEISKRKVITGIISIEVGNDFFPEQNWNDAIVTVLNSWIENMIQILGSGNNEAKLTFFDGPFFFVIRKKLDQSVVELFRNSRSNGTDYIDIRKFGYSLLKTSQEVVKEIDRRGWESEDVTQLTILIQRLLLNLDLLNKEN